MQKFFVEKQNWNKEENLISITGEEVNHIKNVLRYKEGEKVEIKIIGGEKLPKFLCYIEKIEKNEIECSIINEINNLNESDIYLHIIQGLPKLDKMEQVIEKGTELGVKEFTPIKLKRCVAKIDKSDENKKIARWQKIALTAAKQSKRDLVPKVNTMYDLKNIFDILKEYDIVLVAYEDEKNVNLKEEIHKIKNIKNAKIAVVIGPEGGFDLEEIEFFKTKGAKIVSLGKRILRTETAGIAIASVIMYEFNDFC